MAIATKMLLFCLRIKIEQGVLNLANLILVQHIKTKQQVP